MKYQTLMLYLSVISNFYLKQNQPCRSNSMFQLHRILKGIYQMDFKLSTTIPSPDYHSHSVTIFNAVTPKLFRGSRYGYHIQAEHWGDPCLLLFLRPCLQVPDFFNVTPLSHVHATMTDFTYSLEKNYYKNSQIIITLISKIDLII